MHGGFALAESHSVGEYAAYRNGGMGDVLRVLAALAEHAGAIGAVAGLQEENAQGPQAEWLSASAKPSERYVRCRQASLRPPRCATGGVARIQRSAFLAAMEFENQHQQQQIVV